MRWLGERVRREHQDCGGNELTGAQLIREKHAVRARLEGNASRGRKEEVRPTGQTWGKRLRVTRRSGTVLWGWAQSWEWTSEFAKSCEAAVVNEWQYDIRNGTHEREDRRPGKETIEKEGEAQRDGLREYLLSLGHYHISHDQENSRKIDELLLYDHHSGGEWERRDL